MNGMELPLAVMVTIPEPWSNNKSMDPEKAGLLSVLRHHAGTLGRPCLHPLLATATSWALCWTATVCVPAATISPRTAALSSPVRWACWIFPPDDIVKKDRLRPGKMLLVDTVKGELVDDEQLKADYASRQPYGEWLDRNLVDLGSLKIPNRKVPSHSR